MTAEEARSILRPGDKLRPCSHLRAVWSETHPNERTSLETFWEKSPEEPKRWFVGCGLCNQDALDRKMTLRAVVEESRLLD